MGWHRHSTRVVYENNWIVVREDEVTNPGGGHNLYGHVHFRNVAVAILPLDEDGCTHLVGQSRYTLNEHSWELPMGGAPLGEDPLEAAKRELKEETGLSASHWREVLRLHLSNSITDELGIAYVATGLTSGERQLEETEDIIVRTLPLEDAVQMALDGEITDAMSVATLLRAALTDSAPGDDDS
ncbi:MAG: NUDIX hydrolase [Woeseiaceae bacterium]|jgi:8-oxo-dGTP pyrophosphatase MutT (NUDIX family)